MLDRLRQWFTPKPLRIARDQRKLEMLLAEAGVSQARRKRIVSAVYNPQRG